MREWGGAVVGEKGIAEFADGGITTHSDRERLEKQYRAIAIQPEPGIEHSSGDVPYTDNPAPPRQREHGRQVYAEPKPSGLGGRGGEDWRTAKPRVGVPDDGLPGRMAGLVAGDGWFAAWNGTWTDGEWEDGIPRVSAGVKNRIEKLKALGNAVAPQQIYPIFRAIAEIERSVCDER
jgi:hypothetical protein